MKTDRPCDLLMVLHAHLPFVRHPEYAYALEENWFYEAVTDTYLPLLKVFEELVEDGIPFSMTLSLSPTLCSMLDDPLLLSRCGSYLERLLLLCDREMHRTRSDAALHRLARYYADHYKTLYRLFHAKQGRLLPAFRGLQESGHLELITTAATHAFLPFVSEPKVRNAQISAAIEQHARFFGRPPAGFWLPECAYDESLTSLLVQNGICYSFLETHGLLNARPHPVSGVYAPVLHPDGIAFFGRDPDCSRQVWSAVDGYPGDPAYRDFYRDIGFDLPIEDIRPYIHPDGIRVQTGIKYHRVTGPHVDLASKALYDPVRALERVAEHARHFVYSRVEQSRALFSVMQQKPVMAALYDAELFGHWWFEGPSFLKQVCIELNRASLPVVLSTPTRFLQENPQRMVCRPSTSSWGHQGDAETWVNGKTDWIYPHVHAAEKTMVDCVQRYVDHPDPLIHRVLAQMGRELFLLQSSDWAFLIKNGTAAQYAVSRVQCHLARFLRLAGFLRQDPISMEWLQDLENRDFFMEKLDLGIFL